MSREGTLPVERPSKELGTAMRANGSTAALAPPLVKATSSTSSPSPSPSPKATGLKATATHAASSSQAEVDDKSVFFAPVTVALEHGKATAADPTKHLNDGEPDVASSASAASSPARPKLLRLDHQGDSEGVESLTRRLKSAIGQDLLVTNSAGVDDGSRQDLDLARRAAPEGPTTQGGTNTVLSSASSSTSTRAADIVPQTKSVDIEEADTGRWGWTTLTSISATLRFDSLRFRDEGSETAVTASQKTPLTALPPPPSSSSSLSSSSSSYSSSGPSSSIRKWWGKRPESSSALKIEANALGAGSPPFISSDAQGSTRAEEAAPLPAMPKGSFPVSKSRNSRREKPLSDKLREGGETGRLSDIQEQRANLDEALGDDQGSFPTRQYLIITSAGKPVFLSHLGRSRPKGINKAVARPSVSSDARTGRSLDCQASTVDEEDDAATARCGVVQALISNYASLGSEKLHEMSKQVLELPAKSRIAFLLRPPLFLVAISRWGEAHSTLRQHLDLLHLAILSIVSASQLQRHFDRSAGFDLRRLLEGTDGILDSMVSHVQRDMTTVLSAIQTLKLDPTLRDDVGLALVPPKGDARPKDVLYAMLLSGQRIVTLARPKRHNVHPADCHLLVNTVYATKAMRESGTESWIPICLPKFAPQGFVHAHVTFIDGNVDGVETSLDLALVLVTGNKEGFSEMSAWKGHIIEKLRGSGILSRLATALNADATYSADDLAVAGLRHFVFKWRHNILATSPYFENPYSLESEAHHRLMTLYSIAHDRVLGIQERKRQEEEEDEEMIKANGNDADAPAPDRGDDKGVVEGSPLHGSDLRPGTPPIRPKSVLHYTSQERSTSRKATKRPRALPPSMHFLATSSEAVLAWCTMTFELYMVTSPHLSHSALVAAAKAIVKWIKAHEHELFLISTPVF